MAHEDIKKVVEDAVKAAIQKELGAYKVDKEVHYLDHQWIATLREFQKSAKSSILKSIIGLLVTAGAALVLGGIYFLLLMKGVKQ